MNATADKLAAALRGCVAESSPEEYAETVDGAANLTAHDWIARAMATLREQDNGKDAIISDLLDDLGRASRRLLNARAALVEYDAQGECRADAAALRNAVKPLIASLMTRINANNAMSPQAVMVRQAAAALVEYDAQGVQRDPFDNAELATILAALRYYPRNGMGEVPGIVGQWIPRERCAMLAPLLHALLDGCKDCMPSQDWDANDSAALRMLADDLEQGSTA